jgi:hypothetical protein
MNNFLRLGAAVLALTMGACATIDDPKVLAETRTSAPSQAAPSKILVVFDIALEKDYLPKGGLVVSAADWRDNTWGSIERSLRQWGGPAGVEVSTLVHTDPVRPPVFNPRDYSHVVYEKLTRGTGVTGSNGTYMKNRVWTVSVIPIAASRGAPTEALYKATYASDGINCLYGPMYANKDDCRKKYFKLLSSHLQAINPQWPDLAEAPLTKPAAR